MTMLDPYERWRRAKADETPPSDFADRVMAAVTQAEANRRTQIVSRFFVFAWIARRQQAIALTLAGAAFLLRLAAAFSLFIGS